MPESKLSQFLILPKLKLLKTTHVNRLSSITYLCETTSSEAPCPHCGLINQRVHDYRSVTIKDAPLWGRKRFLKIKKKRFRCMGCKKVYTESIEGIEKRARLTERFHRHLLYVATHFANLKSVRGHLKVGNKTLYEKHYKQLELKEREVKNDPWPKTIGIDEHSFIRNKEYGYREFATIIVDYNNQRVKELVPGRISGQLQMSLAHIKGRQNVKNVCMDLSSTYRSFAKEFFPQARIIADKFHVLRLLNPALNRRRKAIAGDARKAKIGRLLLKRSDRLDYFTRKHIWEWLNRHPELKEVYTAKEALHRLYRCKGYKRAKQSLVNLLDVMAKSQVKEIKTLRKTLMKWKDEILNYFKTKLTNARTEGYNNVCKQLQKRAYGYKNFNNYRLKVLYACR